MSKKLYLFYLIILLLVVVAGSVVYAAIFDSDLIPNQDNYSSVGSNPSSRFKNARFSGKVGIGVDNNREEDVNASDRLVLGPTDPISGEGGQLKLLGTSTDKYIVLDNYNNDLRIITASGTESERLRVTSGGYVQIGTGTTTVPGEKLEVVGNIVSKGTEWTSRTSAANNPWQGITYGNGLFVAVAASPGSATCVVGTDKCVMTSPDGINWTLRSTPDNNAWATVTYGNGLFVAVAYSGTNRIMTSPDGINWIPRTSVTNNSWRSVTYGNGLFVAVANTGSGNRVITSPDGINWTPRITPIGTGIENEWQSVTYGNGLFVAIAPNDSVGTSCASGINKCAMSSPDGINWTLRDTPANNFWYFVTYGNGLFVAVSDTGTNDRVMTSPDGGINTPWALRTTPVNNWQSVTYGNGLFVAVSDAGTNDRVMTSPDGIIWTTRISAANKTWQGVTYGNGMFVAVARNDSINNLVMTSGKTDYQITPTNNIYQGGMIIMGSATGTLSIGTTTPTTLFTVATTTNIFNITSDGKVGIGTAAPTNALTIDGVGGLRVRQPSATRYYSDFSVSGGSSTIIAYDSTNVVYIPINFRGSAFKFYATSTPGAGTTEVGSIDASGNWYLGGTLTTGLKIRGLDTTNTIYQTAGNLGITVSAGYIILNGGNVGIGTSNPAQKLQVLGDIRIGTSATNLGCIQNFAGTAIAGACSSDLRLKKNLIPLTNSLDKLIQLKPIYYNWRADEYPELHFNGASQNLGLIAQEVEKVFPELVGVDEKGFKTMNYGVDLTMYIIEAVKELNVENDSIVARIKKLESH